MSSKFGVEDAIELCEDEVAISAKIGNTVRGDPPIPADELEACDEPGARDWLATLVNEDGNLGDEVGGVGGRGDLGDVGGRGLCDVVPVHPGEERMTPEVEDSILAHPDLGGADQSPHQVLGAVRGLHIGREVETGLSDDVYY